MWGLRQPSSLAYDGIADVVLYDIIEGVPQGKALDIAEACPLYNSSVSVRGTNSFDDTAAFGCRGCHSRFCEEAGHEQGGPGSHECRDREGCRG